MVLTYYMKTGQKLREKYNKERIEQQLQSILNQQMYQQVIETDEANDIAQTALYSLNSDNDCNDNEYNDDDYDFTQMNSTFDADKHIQFTISNSSQIDDICRDIDHLLDSLLNIAVPGVEQLQYNSAEQTAQTDITYVKSFYYDDDSTYDYSIIMAKPSILDQLLELPVKLTINMLRINDEGFLKVPQFSYFNDIQNRFKLFNLQLEVKNLQLNIYFKKRNQMRVKESKFISSYIKFVKNCSIEMQWIFTKQILEIYLYFDDSQSKKIQQAIDNMLTNSTILDKSELQLKIVQHHNLNAAIVNDVKIDLLNCNRGEYIKKVYFSNEIKSDQFDSLGQNNNISFIHTQSFTDSKDIKYKSYKLKAGQKNQQNDLNDSQISDRYDSNDDSQLLSELNYLKLSAKYSSDNYDDNNELPNLIQESKKQSIRYDIFQIYNSLIETHFTRQTFIFSSYDIHSKQLSNLIRNGKSSLNVCDLIHKKTSTMLSIAAFNQVSHLIQFKPNQMIWDLYIR